MQQRRRCARARDARLATLNEIKDQPGAQVLVDRNTAITNAWNTAKAMPDSAEKSVKVEQLKVETNKLNTDVSNFKQQLDSTQGQQNNTQNQPKEIVSAFQAKAEMPKAETPKEPAPEAGGKIVNFPQKNEGATGSIGNSQTPASDSAPAPQVEVKTAANLTGFSQSSSVLLSNASSHSVMTEAKPLADAGASVISQPNPVKDPAGNFTPNGVVNVPPQPKQEQVQVGPQ